MALEEADIPVKRLQTPAGETFFIPKGLREEDFSIVIVWVAVVRHMPRAGFKYAIMADCLMGDATERADAITRPLAWFQNSHTADLYAFCLSLQTHAGAKAGFRLEAKRYARKLRRKWRYSGRFVILDEHGCDIGAEPTPRGMRFTSAQLHLWSGLLLNIVDATNKYARDMAFQKAEELYRRVAAGQDR